MTVQELLNADADTLERMTDKELEAIFAPFLDVTRPDRVLKQERLSKPIKSNSHNEKLKQLAALGLDISNFI